ncbi:MAG: EamA family transporter [Bacilli bacterium]|nr:EamA family transporter [Bacilli bacterium]
MNIFSNWIFIIILFLVCDVTYNQGFKQLTKKIQRDGAMIVLLDCIAGLLSLLLIFFFKWQLPSNKWTYFFLGIACLFYALNDRLGTTARKGIPASTFSMLKQLSTVFMIFAGLIFFKEKLILTKLCGGMLIVFSNILVFYDKKIKFNKYILFGFLATLCTTIALFIDVNYSDEFNLPLYVAITLIFPSILIFLFERIKIKDIIIEYKISNKKILFITIISSALMLIFKLYAYQLGDVIIIAPLCSLAIILNVLVESIFFGEKTKIFRKILASILIIVSILLIRL